MSCSAGCTLAMSRVICSWPAASCSTLCRTAARSRAIASSCWRSGEAGRAAPRSADQNHSILCCEVPDLLSVQGQNSRTRDDKGIGSLARCRLERPYKITRLPHLKRLELYLPGLYFAPLGARLARARAPSGRERLARRLLRSSYSAWTGWQL